MAPIAPAQDITPRRHMHLPTTIPASNRVPAAAVFALLGFPSVQAMNHARRRLQKVRYSGQPHPAPYPDFAAAHFPDEAAELARVEAELRRCDKRAEPLGTAELGDAVRQQHQRLRRLVRPLEVAFDSAHTLVVEEWGGIRYPRASWTYDLAVCTALATRGTAALLRTGGQR